MQSRSPCGTTYSVPTEDDLPFILEFVEKHRKDGREIVAIQGLGFVGAVMLAAVAESAQGRKYAVIGLDRPDEKNYWKIAKVNDGIPPVVTTDEKVHHAFGNAHQRGNVIGTGNPSAYAFADIVVVDVHLDILKTELGRPDGYDFEYGSFEQALETVARHVHEEALVLIETTVPPGTTERFALPLFQRIFGERGLDPKKVRLAHSYERVMPGPNYLDSITNFYRVFAGVDEDTQSVSD